LPSPASGPPATPGTTPGTLPGATAGPTPGREAPHDARQGVIRVRVREVGQLFNSLDPSPFLERDLDDDMVDYITSWAREIPADRPLRLVVHLTQPPRGPDDRQVLEAAIRNYFANAAELKQNEFRQLMRRGWRSLAIGLAVLGATIVAGHLIGAGDGPSLAVVLRQSVLIGGWVAMWRPLEILLYDWWPVRAECVLHERLRDAQVDLVIGS